MTNEEVERAIDFLLRSQGNSEARIEQTNQQLNRLTERVVRVAEGLDVLRTQLGAFADTQVELMRVLTKSIEEGEQFRESQKRINEAQMRINEALVNSHTRAEEAQARVNESLAVGQANTAEALARLADAQAQSERSLDRLTRIVEEERGGR